MNFFLIALGLFYSVSLISPVYCQAIVNSINLIERDNFFYYNEELFDGYVFQTFENGQLGSMGEIKDGQYNGKFVYYRKDKFSFQFYRDTSEINKRLIEKNMKEKYLEKIKLDSSNLSIEMYDFIENEIGGIQKLEKYKEKRIQGKLNKKNTEKNEKYDQFVQKSNSLLETINNTKNEINTLKKWLSSEYNKPLYVPQKIIEYSYINGIKEGPAIFFDTLGNKLCNGNFSNNYQNGIWTYYYSNGQILAKGNFIFGDGGNKSKKSGIPMNGRDGRWLVYYENGILEQDGMWKNGLLNGVVKTFYKSGQIKVESFFKDNIKEGESKEYYENGNLFQVENYVSNKLNGKKLVYYNSGIIMKEYIYSGGLKSGLEIQYNEIGKKTAEINWLNDIIHGIQRTFHKNEKIATEYNYYNGIAHGQQKNFYESGKLKLSQNMSNGKIHGKLLYYFESGKLNGEVYYQNNKKHGPFVIYFENGKAQLKGTYDTLSLEKDNFIGDLFQYSEDGKLILHGYANKDGKWEDKMVANSKSPKIQKSNMGTKCAWCGKSFQGLGWSVDDQDFYGGCSYSENYSSWGMSIGNYYCSQKCASDKCKSLKQ